MIEKLQRLGLTENESRIYLVLLELGSTTAGKIIKKTKLHRNIVYDNLDKLIGKGLISFVIIKNIKHFELNSPSELIEYIKNQKQEILEKENIVKKILPRIEEKRDFERKQEATIFKGKRGLKTITDEMTKAKTEILVFGTGWGMRETMGTYYEQWHLKLRKNKINARILLPENRRGLYLKPFTAKYLKEEKILPSTIVIWEDKILNIVWEEEPMAVLIISEKTADSYKNYFNLLWKQAKK
jgi:sugar-specific transcriptional regulator TrmB